MAFKINDINNVEDLVKFILMTKPEFIVMCGYDNVGKGKIIRDIQSHHLFPHSDIYRPNYEYWSPRLAQPFRWTIFMSFLDVLDTFKNEVEIKAPLVFDRSAICGAVYNNDASIARDYAEKIKSHNCLHVLVTCKNRKEYEKLLSVRGSSTHITYEEYLVYTERYRCYLEAFELKYVEIVNEYDEKLGEELSTICGGCSHYVPIKDLVGMPGDGLCNLKHIYVYKSDERCNQYSEPDIQDKEERNK